MCKNVKLLLLFALLVTERHIMTCQFLSVQTRNVGGRDNNLFPDTVFNLVLRWYFVFVHRAIYCKACPVDEKSQRKKAGTSLKPFDYNHFRKKACTDLRTSYADISQAPSAADTTPTSVSGLLPNPAEEVTNPPLNPDGGNANSPCRLLSLNPELISICACVITSKTSNSDGRSPCNVHTVLVTFDTVSCSYHLISQSLSHTPYLNLELFHFKV